MFSKKLPKFSKLTRIVLALTTATAGIYLAILSFAAVPTLPIQVQGTLRIFHADYKPEDLPNAPVDGTLLFTLDTVDGIAYRVKFPAPYPRVLSGSLVAISGILQEPDLIVVPTLNPPDFVVIQAQEIMESERKVAIIPFIFKEDEFADVPINKDRLKEMVFTNSDSADKYFREVSFGTKSLVGKQNTSGDLFGWYRLSFSRNTLCQDYKYLDKWAKEAIAAAKSSGNNLDGYDHIIFVPATTKARNNSCWYGGGWGEIGDNGDHASWSWVYTDTNTSYMNDVFKHELGHNFGTWHASTLSCKDQYGVRMAIYAENKCSVDEYGDRFDVMGNGGFGFVPGKAKHLNVFHKGILRFLKSENIKTISNLTSTTTIKIYPIEKKSSNIQLAQIEDDYVEYGGYGSQNYYLEYRRPYGFDDFPNNSPAVNGITIRKALEIDNYWDNSLLIDTTPGSKSNIYLDHDDASLQLGKTFYDSSETKLSIKVTEVTDGYATVTITYGRETEPPTAPANLKTTNVGLNSLSLEWTKSTDNVTVNSNDIHYEVYRAPGASGEFIKIADVYNPPLSYNDTGLNPGNMYRYYVKAIDYEGNVSSPSTTISVSTPTLPSLTIASSPITGVSIDAAACGYNSYTTTGTCGITNWTWTSNSNISYTSFSAPDKHRSGEMRYIFSHWTGCDNTGGAGSTCWMGADIGQTKIATANYTELPPGTASVTIDSRLTNDDKPFPGVKIETSGACGNTSWTTTGTCGTTSWTWTSDFPMQFFGLVAPLEHKRDLITYTFSHWSGCDFVYSDKVGCRVGNTDIGEHEVVRAHYTLSPPKPPLTSLTISSSPITGVKISPSAGCGSYPTIGTCGTTNWTWWTSNPDTNIEQYVFSAPNSHSSGGISYKFSHWTGCDGTVGGLYCVVGSKAGQIKSAVANYVPQ